MALKPQDAIDTAIAAILAQHMQTAQTSPSANCFPSLAVDPGMVGRVMRYTSGATVDSESPGTEGLEMRADEKDVLKKVTAELDRVRFTVKALESQLETERREKNAWKSKCEELERLSKSSPCSSVHRATVGPGLKESDTNSTIDTVSPPPTPRALRSSYAPPITAPMPAILERVGAINPPPCWEYYLSPQGCLSGIAAPGSTACKFPHHHRFTPGELLALRYLAQKSRCPKGLNCVDKLCYYGHQCQVLEGEVCQGGSKCEFKKEEHVPELLIWPDGTKVALREQKAVAASIIHNRKVTPIDPRPGLKVPIMPSSKSIFRVVPTVRAVNSTLPPVQVDADKVAALLTALSSKPKTQRAKNQQGSLATRQRKERRARAKTRAEEVLEERKRNKGRRGRDVTGRTTENVEEPMTRFTCAKKEATNGREVTLAPGPRKAQANAGGSEEQGDKQSSTGDTALSEVEDDLLVWNDKEHGAWDTVIEQPTPGALDEDWDAPIPASFSLAPPARAAFVARDDEINLLEF